MKPETDVELRDPSFPYEADDTILLATRRPVRLVRAEESRPSSRMLRSGRRDRRARSNCERRGGHDNITCSFARATRIETPGRRLAPNATRPTLVERALPVATSGHSSIRYLLAFRRPPATTAAALRCAHIRGGLRAAGVLCSGSAFFWWPHHRGRSPGGSCAAVVDVTSARLSGRSVMTFISLAHPTPIDRA